MWVICGRNTCLGVYANRDAAIKSLTDEGYSPDGGVIDSVFSAWHRPGHTSLLSELTLTMLTQDEPSKTATPLLCD